MQFVCDELTFLLGGISQRKRVLYAATTKIPKKNKPGRKQRNSVKNVTYPSAKRVLKCFIQRVKYKIHI